ncbi:MAG: hypothetical protein AAFQ74_13115 [Cyanobacteria bacterium J06623_4]
MSGKPFISARIPEELRDSLEKQMELTGKSKTDIIVDALRKYLNDKDAVFAGDSAVALEKRLDKFETHISERIDTLQKDVIAAFVEPEQLKQVNKELHQLEKKGFRVDWKAFSETVMGPLRRHKDEESQIDGSTAAKVQ